ncbi:MAG: aspartate aminotransferase family protein [Burkholderiales bacterium]|jgi:putrescine aminotransferase|nr:aspartate aminotransferase family protein [Burkholderiales bacterium]
MPVSNQTQQLRVDDFNHYLHPFSDMLSINNKGARIIVKGDGCYIWDSENNKIFDAMSGLWCVNLGYGQKSLIDAATEQLNTLAFYNSFFQTANTPAIELSKAIASVAPDGFNRVFFTNSGSEANDTMIRMVRRYWDIKGQSSKKIIISRWNAYHGSTMGGASLSGMKYMHEQGDLPIPGIVHIAQPYQLENGLPNETETDFALRAANWLEEKILELGAQNVAAFVGEPVQGAGGVIIPPSGYWLRIQEICKKYDILLVADEVICGFGRLGYWFASQHPHININPDLIIIAKGLTSGYIPMGGVIVHDKVSEVLVHQGGDFNHGFTYSGHPVAANVGVATIKYIKEQKLLQHLQQNIIPYFATKFAQLNNHPLVGDAQSIGLVAGLVLYQDKQQKKHFAKDLHVDNICREFCFNNGVVMRGVGNRMIIAPPLVMNQTQVDEIISKIVLSLDNLFDSLKVKGIV